jgi:hypothetical protein
MKNRRRRGAKARRRLNIVRGRGAYYASKVRLMPPDADDILWAYGSLRQHALARYATDDEAMASAERMIVKHRAALEKLAR